MNFCTFLSQYFTGKVQTFAEVVADAEPAPAVEDEKVIKTKI